MKYLLIILRTILMIFLTIIMFPAIIIILIMWLIYCRKSCELLGCDKKQGFKVWLTYIKTGLSMNKDFILNGMWA